MYIYIEGGPKLIITSSWKYVETKSYLVPFSPIVLGISTLSLTGSSLKCTRRLLPEIGDP